MNSLRFLSPLQIFVVLILWLFAVAICVPTLLVAQTTENEQTQEQEEIPEDPAVTALKALINLEETFKAVSYTHPPSPRDLSTSRMPSSA